MSSKWLRLFLVAALVGALMVPAAVASAADDDARVFATLGQCDGVVHDANDPYSIEYPTAATVYDFWGRAIINAKGFDAGVRIMENVAAWPLGVVRNTYILGSDFADLICGATGNAAAIPIPVIGGGNDFIKARGGNDEVYGQDGDNANGPLNLWTPANVAFLRGIHGLFGGVGDMIWGGQGDDYIDLGWSPADFPTPIIPIPPVLAPVLAFLPLPFGNTFPVILGGTATTDGMLIGGAGMDILVGGFGSDFLRGRAHADVIADPGSFGIWNPPVDMVYGDGGDDTIGVDLALTGSTNYVYSGRGDDFVVAGIGDDFLVGGVGDDFILDLGNFAGGNFGVAPRIPGGVFFGDWVEGNLGNDDLIVNLAGFAAAVNTVWTAEPFYTLPLAGLGIFTPGDLFHDMAEDEVWLGGDGFGLATNTAFSCETDLLVDEFGLPLGVPNDDVVYWGGLIAPWWLGGPGPGDGFDTTFGFDEFVPNVGFFDLNFGNICAFVHPGA